MEAQTLRGFAKGSGQRIVNPTPENAEWVKKMQSFGCTIRAFVDDTGEFKIVVELPKMTRGEWEIWNLQYALTLQEVKHRALEYKTFLKESEIRFSPKNLFSTL